MSRFPHIELAAHCAALRLSHDLPNIAATLTLVPVTIDQLESWLEELLEAIDQPDDGSCAAHHAARIRAELLTVEEDMAEEIRNAEIPRVTFRERIRSALHRDG